MENLKFEFIKRFQLPELELARINECDKLVFGKINDERSYIIGTSNAISVNGRVIDVRDKSFRYFEFIPTLLSAVIVTSSEILLFHDLNSDHQNFPVDFDDILLCDLSPVDDYLLVIDTDYEISLLSVPDFDVENGIELFDDSTVKQLLNVGWGSEKTQFQGSKKGTTDIVGLEQSSIQMLYSSWSPDSEMIAISYWQIDRRKIKLFTKQLQILNICDHVGGLTGSIVWRYDSNYLYAVQIVFDEQNLVTFEKNGLKFSSFSLRSRNKVNRLCWHPEVPILLVIYDAIDNKTQLHFWTVKNCHWYLKKCLHFEDLLSVTWDLNDPLGFNVITKGHHFLYSLNYVIDSSLVVDSRNLCSVAFIDGYELHLTNFLKEIIPPPFSKYTLKFDSEVAEVSFSQFDSRSFLVFLQNRQVLGFSICDNSYDQIFQYIDGVQHPEEVIKWGFLPNNQVYRFDLDHKLTLFNVQDESLQFEVQHVIPDNNITVVVPNFSGGYQLDGFILLTLNNYKKVELHKVNSNVYSFVLYKSGKLFVNDKQLDSNVKSFALTVSFLLIVSVEHRLKWVSLQELLCDGSNSVKNIEYYASFYQRSLEIGSEIVAVSSTSSQVILQMPRGNIETIHPRVLIIDELSRLLKDCEYAKAYGLMEKHRINLNLFYDLSDTFLDNLNAFIEAIVAKYCEKYLINAKLITLLSQLENKNVLNSLYGNWYAKSKKNLSFDTKCRTVTIRFRDVISKNYKIDDFLPTVIVSHVVQNCDKNLVDALEIVWNAKSSSSKLWTQDYLLKLVLNMCDLKKLYECCLRYSRLELATFIVSNSDSDPKLYLPFLHEINDLDDDRRMFRIHNHLKDYRAALKHYLRFEKFDFIVDYVKKHKLYVEAINDFDKSKIEEFRQISDLGAQFLVENKKFEEAAKVLESCQLYEKAYSCYLRNFDVVQCVRILHLMCLTDDALKNKISELIVVMSSTGNHKSVAELYSEFFADYKNAILSLIKGEFWLEAYQLAIFKHRPDDVDQCIKPELISASTNFIEHLKEIRVEIVKYSDRLKTIWSQKLLMKNSTDDTGQDVEFNDTQSMISYSSTTTSSSTLTGTTSRLRRKMKKIEKKKNDLKQGGEFEDIAIIKYLYDVINNVYKEDLKRTQWVHMLKYTNEGSLANRLLNEYDQLIEFIEQKVNDIWPKTMTDFSLECRCNNYQLIAIMKNFQYLESQYRYPPLRK